MRVHAGRTGAAVALLAEIGAVVGALGGWLYLVGSTMLWNGLPTANGLLGAALWAGLFGAPVGALTLPLLGLTLLRRTPIGRSVASYTVGLLLGVGIAILLSPHAPAPPTVAPFVPGLALTGALTGALVARRYSRDERAVHPAS